MIVDRDKEIIRYLEKYKYASLQQIQKVFFRDVKYSYGIASRRLIEIKKAGYIKVMRDIANNCNVYVYNDPKIKPPTMHRMLVLDVLAELYYCGCIIEQFEIEKFWLQGRIRSDGFVVFTIKDQRFHFFIEVQVSNNYHNLEKYNELYKSGEVQTYLGKDLFPRIILISNTNYPDIHLQYSKVIQLDLNLNQFVTVFM